MACPVAACPIWVAWTSSPDTIKNEKARAFARAFFYAPVLGPGLKVGYALRIEKRRGPRQPRMKSMPLSNRLCTILGALIVTGAATGTALPACAQTDDLGNILTPDKQTPPAKTPPAKTPPAKTPLAKKPPARAPVKPPPKNPAKIPVTAPPRRTTIPRPGDEPGQTRAGPPQRRSTVPATAPRRPVGGIWVAGRHYASLDTYMYGIWRWRSPRGQNMRISFFRNKTFSVFNTATNLVWRGRFWTVANRQLYIRVSQVCRFRKCRRPARQFNRAFPTRPLNANVVMNGNERWTRLRRY